MTQNRKLNTEFEQRIWKPGQSGNPLGRPKKEFSLTDGMREFLSEKDPDKKKARKDLLIEKTFTMAQKGDISAIKLLWNYLEGMPKGSSAEINNNIVIPILGGTSVSGNNSDHETITIKQED